MNTTLIPSMGAILEADEHGVVVTTLQTALELDIFEIIDSGAYRLEDIAQAAHCSNRGMSVLLDALCAKDLLTKFINGSYGLSPTSETYLVRSGRGYCVPIYLGWMQAREKFIDFVRTGEATLDLTRPEAEDIWVSYAAPDRVRLTELLELVHKRWTSSGIPSRLPAGARILDLGCGSGFKGFGLLQIASTAHITCVDSPKVLEITRDVAEQAGVISRVKFQNGDVDRELPSQTFDMVLIGNLLHYYDPGTDIEIMQRVHRALKPGGLMVIYTKFADEERKTDISLLSMVDISNCAPHAQQYTFSEYRTMLEAAGFRDVERPEVVLISAIK